MIITIDGTVATGKSTVARKLAEAIGFIFFDTGAMYRAVTYAILKQSIDINNLDLLAKFLNSFDFDIKIIKRERHYFLGNEEITEKIRRNEISANVSRVSAVKMVRDKLVEIQRELSVGVNAVFEGRDMGTTVFPEATVKIFLTGRPEVRARRRYNELKAKFPEDTKNLTLEGCMEEINQRDLYDSTRELSPLKPADDAYVIDTSDLTIDEIVFKILEYKDGIKTRRHSSP